MPLPSKFAVPRYVSPGSPGFRSGYEDDATFSPPPASQKRVTFTDYDPDPRLLGSDITNYDPRRFGPTPVPYHHSHNLPAPEHRPDHRSPTYIEMSSDDSTPDSIEVTRLREEVVRLKVERGKLKGQLEALSCV
jgi:hypothetical protein